MIHEFAQRNNEVIFYRGLFYNSYIAYLLGVTTVNPMDKNYYLYPELALGLDGTKQLPLDVNVSKTFRIELLKYLRELLNGNFYLKENSTFKYCVLLENNKDLDLEKNGILCVPKDLNPTSNILVMNIIYLKALDGLNILIRKNGYPKEDIYTNNGIYELFYNERIAGLPGCGGSRVKNIWYHKWIDYSSFLAVSSATHGTNTYWPILQENTDNYDYFTDYPTSRDGIMTYLIHSGIDREISFQITNLIRLGSEVRERNLEQWQEYQTILKKHIPKNIFDYLSQIEYVFPLGHAIAYTQFDLLLQYYKLKDPDFYKIMMGDQYDYYHNLTLHEISTKKINADSFEFYQLRLAEEELSNTQAEALTSLPEESLEDLPF